MHCPRCYFYVASAGEKCPQCGYEYENINSSRRLPPAVKLIKTVDAQGLIGPTTGSLGPTTGPLGSDRRTNWAFMRGDTVGKGRYRLIEEVRLPSNQLSQGNGWIALDLQTTHHQRVLLQHLDLAQVAVEAVQPMVDALKQRLAPLGEHPGLPVVTNIFQEQGVYYIAQRHPTGESLAALMQQQGGSLPERDIANYAFQVCAMLAILARQQPPIIHGAISTETIILSTDKRQVSLIYVPLFPLQASKAQKSESSATHYLAPEQAKGDLQPSSDLYALAAVMHHAVTGFDPRERMIFFYPPARRLNPVVSVGMEAVLARQLRYSLSQRYMHPEEMQRELSVLLNSYPATIEPSNPAMTSNSMPLVSVAGSARTRRKSSRAPVFVIAGLVVLLLLTLASLLLYQSPALIGLNTGPDQNDLRATQTARNRTALSQLLVQEQRSFEQKGIGLSDGRLIFDTYTGRTDTSLKQQAATAIQQGNTSAAVNLLDQAVTTDPIDGEALIYNENLHIQQNNSASVTLAVGLPIDGSAAHLNSDREQLESVYLAQHEANSKGLLPGGLKLRVLIANSGASNADVATVAQFIANRVNKAGNLDNLIGVVGWYNSSQTINARDIIASAHLPLMAPTASSVKLTGSSPYFFRVAPPDNQQGQILGTLLVQNLKASKVLILNDPTDTYSVSLANAVSAQIQQLGATFTAATFTENTTTVDQYQQIIQSNVDSNTPANIVFIAGVNVDGVRLAHAVGNAARANPLNQQLADLKIVGGDAVDSGLLLGQGSNDDAALARQFPLDMRKLIFTTFAAYNEWDFGGIVKSKQPVFFNDWVTNYQRSMIGTNAPNPSYKGLMIYDAVGSLLDAATLVHGTITGNALVKALLLLGTGNVPAYQGISGKITFDDKGNPVNKSVVILTVQAAPGGANEIAIQKIVGTFN